MENRWDAEVLTASQRLRAEAWSSAEHHGDAGEPARCLTPCLVLRQNTAPCGQWLVFLLSDEGAQEPGPPDQEEAQSEGDFHLILQMEDDSRLD